MVLRNIPLQYVVDSDGTPLEVIGERKIETNEKSTLTPDVILRLAQDNPTVHNYYMGYQKGWITWEQMLIGCVQLLAAQNKQLTETIANMLNNRSF
jgi:hypothetical protein